MKQLVIKYLVFLLLFWFFCSMTYHFAMSTLGDNDSYENIVRKVDRGVLLKLQEKLRNYPLSEWNQQLQAMQPEHGSAIVVKKISDLNIPKKYLDMIRSGKTAGAIGVDGHGFFSYYVRAGSVYQRIGHSEYVLLMRSFAGSVTDAAEYILAWNIKLVIDELKPYPERMWQQQMSHLQALYGYPLALIRLNSTRIPEAVRKQLTVKKMALDLSTGEVRNAYVRMPNSQWVIKFGPVRYAFYYKHIERVFLVLLLLFIVLFIIGSHLLFGRALTKLFKITRAFSQGDFTSTVRLSTYSTLYGLYQQIGSMGEKIQGLMNAQQSMSRLVAHESRTPISRMLFILEEMKETDASPNIAILEQDLVELSDLIDAFLQYAHFQSEPLVLNEKKINVTRWLEKIIAQYTVNPQNIKLRYQSMLLLDQHIVIDSKQLSRVLDSLILNALRYAKQQINISASIDAGEIIITVDDDGLIISDEHKQRLFEPFVPVSQDDQPGARGFGLGLDIVRTIVELHHGTLNVANSSLGGARFIIAIPLLIT